MHKTRCSIVASRSDRFRTTGCGVIADGLQPDDWVAISGLQQIRPRMEVKPVEMSMPIPVDEAA